jgi:hypothetical protein
MNDELSFHLEREIEQNITLQVTHVCITKGPTMVNPCLPAQADIGYSAPMFTSRPNPAQAAYPLPCVCEGRGINMAA